MKNNTNLNPWWVTGFVDAEGYFGLKINPANTPWGWSVYLEFTIGLHVKDIAILHAIQSFFGGIGRVTLSSETVAVFTTRNLGEILLTIIPHFLTYPLMTNKGADFALFHSAALLLQAKLHLTAAGLQQIMNIRASMNKGLPARLLAAFPKTVPSRPLIASLNPTLWKNAWVAGFTSGDGSFGIGIRGNYCSFHFILTQHLRDLELLKGFLRFFGCGIITKNKTWADFRVNNFNDINNSIVPFFNKNSILGVKALNYTDWTKAIDIRKNNKPMTKEGLNIILQIKNNMNSKRS